MNPPVWSCDPCYIYIYVCDHVIHAAWTYGPCRAIMTYHRQKMEDINKIIKELWIKTYRGGGGLHRLLQILLTCDTLSLTNPLKPAQMRLLHTSPVFTSLSTLHPSPDIDTIEIRSDDEMEQPGTIGARRIYHYRVRPYGLSP